MVEQGFIASTYGNGTARIDTTLPLGLASVLSDIVNERYRQDAKWGERNHPDGTGPEVSWGLDDPGYAAEDATTFRQITQDCAAGKLGPDHPLTWLNIALEEIAEAFAEEDSVKLRAELVQCAAVFTAWAEAIDRRAAK